MVQVLREGIERYLPGANGNMLKAVACMFTNTPDTRFIIDLHPHHPQVTFPGTLSPSTSYRKKLASLNTRKWAAGDRLHMAYMSIHALHGPGENCGRCAMHVICAGCGMFCMLWARLQVQ